MLAGNCKILPWKNRIVQEKNLPILTFGGLQGKRWVPALLQAGSQPVQPWHTELLMSVWGPAPNCARTDDHLQIFEEAL